MHARITTMNDKYYTIGKFVSNGEKRALLLQYLKVLGLKEVPIEENDKLKEIIAGNNLDDFMVLLAKYVPDVDKKIEEFISNIENNYEK